MSDMDELPIHRDKSKRHNRPIVVKVPKHYKSAMAEIALSKGVGLQESMRQAIMFYLSQVHGLEYPKDSRP